MTKKEIITRTLIVVACLSLSVIIVSLALWLSTIIIVSNLKSHNTVRWNGKYMNYLDTISAKGNYFSFPRTTTNVVR